jgi:hypothetical protein
VGPIFRLGAEGKRKLSCTCLKSNPDSSAVQAFSPSLYRLSYRGFFLIDNIKFLLLRSEKTEGV